MHFGWTDTTHSIALICKPRCRFCTQAKELLQQSRVPFFETDVSTLTDTETHHIVSFCKQTSHQDTITYPIVFVSGNYLGGFQELKRFLAETQLTVGSFSSHDF